MDAVGYPNDWIPNFYNITGTYPGLIGIDYFYQNNYSMNHQTIPGWFNTNSLITICNHWKNPKTAGSYNPNNPQGPGSAWDTTNVDFVELITDGTVLNTTFKGYLNSVADGLQTLQTNNVTVLYRPLHEMNGSWFWWGAKDSTQLKNLWIYIFNYFTQTKGLHNLLWVWSWGDAALVDWSYYPGGQYVDIVGADIYSSPTVSQIAGYSDLDTYSGKPFGITEYGPCPSSGCVPGVDWSAFIDSVRTNMPRTVFWMNWADTFSMISLTGTSAVLADPWALTNDKIKYW
jgi:mannan endo-1,4-beta-mannosidase